MAQKDYIIRMVEQIVQAILAIIRHRKSGSYKEAREAVRTAGRYLLRMDIDLLLFFTHDWILDHFKDFSKRFETEKCVLGADLFHELALIEEAEQHPDAALCLKILCLNLYTIAIPKEKQFQTPQYFEKVSQLTEELVDQSLSSNILESLSNYQVFLLQLKDK